jgi:hypothetical protein
MTVGSTIMIVVHSIEVSILYPCIVISSLIKRLENILFAITYTFFGVWLRDHYMLLQRITKCSMPHLAKRFPHRSPSCTMQVLSTSCTLLRTTEQGTFLEAILMSEQVVPYQTRGGTYCLEWSIVDVSYAAP